MATLHFGFDSCESPTLHDLHSDANLGLSPADCAFREEWEAHLDDAHTLTDEDLDFIFGQEMQEQDARRKYPGFAKLNDQQLREIVESPFVIAADDDAKEQIAEAAAELLRRKINPNAA